ncbi:carbohydrate porin [Acinetobacter shaoyimingii]|uniref:Carbohydrate porin n=1 Tax=Acinetobacter shaoyimingii TaxID=2715164 RepID=A0A6G8RYC1_9GAMM|nr:carbohydrate porin [Acinetobacter shaoyimingii]QIO06798.1 carbohydrate porin [Acinetobacter shaoyimingii]
MKKTSFTLFASLLCVVTTVYAKHSDQNSSYSIGDQNSNRTRLAQQGIKFDAALFSDTAYLVSGGHLAGARPETSAHFNIGTELDMKKMAGWDGVKIRAVVSARQGQSTGVRHLQHPSAPQLSNSQVTFGRGNQHTRLSELSIEKQFSNSGLNIKVGRITIGNDFDVMACDFQNSSFCGAQMGKWQSNLWMNNPVASWGGRVRYDFDPELTMQMGIYEFNPDNGKSNAEGLGWSLSTAHADGVTIPIEMIWKPQSFINGLPGSYRIGALYNTAHDPNNQKNIATGLPEDHSTGGWIAIEQQLTSTGSDKQGLEMFENFTWHDQATNKIDNTEQIGLEYIGLGTDHPDDMIGLAVNRVHLNKHFVHAKVANGQHQFNAEAEYNIELNYNCHLGKKILIRPDVQYVIHPGSTHNVNNAFVLGLSTKVTF